MTAALHIKKLRGLKQRDCNKESDVQLWHQGGKDGARFCLGGVAILVNNNMTIPIVVADREGTGCQDKRRICSNNYQLHYEVRKGVNILSWCLDTQIHLGDTYVKFPDGLKSNLRGPRLFFPRVANGITDRHTQAGGMFLNQNSNGMKQLLAGEGWVNQPGLNLLGKVDEEAPRLLQLDHLQVYHDNEHLPSWMEEALMGREDPEMQWHYAHVGHKLVNRHIWPRECHCGGRAIKGRFVRRSLDNGNIIYITPSKRMLALLALAPKIVEDEDGHIYSPPGLNNPGLVEVALKPRVRLASPERIIVEVDVEEAMATNSSSSSEATTSSSGSGSSSASSSSSAADSTSADSGETTSEDSTSSTTSETSSPPSSPGGGGRGGEGERMEAEAVEAAEAEEAPGGGMEDAEVAETPGEDPEAPMEATEADNTGTNDPCAD